MTDFEKNVLINIAESEFNEANGNQPESVEETVGWYDVENISLYSKLEVNQVKAVVTNLVKKGYVDIDTDEDSVISLTEEGFKKYKKLKD